MIVALLGAGGQVGREVLAATPAPHVVHAFARAELDIRDAARVDGVLREVRPDWVINASGLTNVDHAEREPEAAFAVNGGAVGALARLCRAHSCGLLHYSTDFVFPGSRASCYAEEDDARPINVYGASKWEGEQRLRREAPRHLIIRTQWVFGAGSGSFLSALWDRAVRRMPTSVVNDQYGQCTYSVDLARFTWQSLGQLEGTYHVANRGRVSRFDIAHRIFAAAGAADLLRGCRGTDMPAAAARPSSSILCTEKIERALKVAIPWWTDAVDRYVLAQRRSSETPS